MADQTAGDPKDRVSGGPNPAQGGGKKPFAVEQARRELADAERVLKDLEKRKIKGPQLDQAKEAVREARKTLRDMTKGDREDRIEARRDFMDEYYNDLGGPWVAELIKRVPELNRLFQKHIRTDDVDGFMDEVYQSDWWNDPEKSTSWKNAFRLEFAKDKTAWTTALSDAEDAIEALADDLYNIEIPPEILAQIARRYVYEGWAQKDEGLRVWLSKQFSNQSRDPKQKDKLTPGGELLDTERALRNAARDYGVTRNDQWFKRTARQILNPNANFDEDDAWNELIAEAESLYPVFAGKLSKDRTVRDVGAGYMAQLARYLELNSVDMIELDDPLLQRAFQNVDEKSGEPTLMPLWRFTQEIKKDDRWQTTSNAIDTYSRIGSELSRMMGFTG